MPETCGHQCSKLRQGLCVGCLEEFQKQKPVPKTQKKEQEASPTLSSKK